MASGAYPAQAGFSLDVLKFFFAVPPGTQENGKGSSMFAVVWFYKSSLSKLQGPCTVLHCLCVTLMGGSAIAVSCLHLCAPFPIFLSGTVMVYALNNTRPLDKQCFM